MKFISITFFTSMRLQSNLLKTMWNTFSVCLSLFAKSATEPISVVIVFNMLSNVDSSTREKSCIQFLIPAGFGSGGDEVSHIVLRWSVTVLLNRRHRRKTQLPVTTRRCLNEIDWNFEDQREINRRSGILSVSSINRRKNGDSRISEETKKSALLRRSPKSSSAARGQYLDGWPLSRHNL